MKKKLIAFLLAVLMVAALMPTTVLAESEVTDTEMEANCIPSDPPDPKLTINIETYDQDWNKINVDGGSVSYEIHNDNKWKLSASANYGYEFICWYQSPDTYRDNNPYIIDRNQDRTVTAIFMQKSLKKLTITVEGSGAVSTDPKGITIDNNNKYFVEHEKVYLYASASHGWEFDHWEGESSHYGDRNPHVHMNQNEHVKAVFTKCEYKIKFRVGDHGTWVGGTQEEREFITKYQDMPPDQSADIDPDDGWEFSGWSPNVVAADGDATYVAQYKQIDYTLTINYVDSETGSSVTTPHTQTLHYGDSYDVDSPSIVGYGSPLPANISGTMPMDDVTKTVEYDPIDYTLTINYVDSDTGLSVSTPHTQTLHYGDNYSVNSPDVAGYGSPSQVVVSGTMPADDLIVTVEYEPVDYTLTINYVDSETGLSVVTTHTQTLRYGEGYSVNSPDVIGYGSPSEAIVSGTMPADDLIVTVEYEPIDYTLTINYVDSETGLPVSAAHTQTLHYGTGYSVNSPDVVGYDSPSEAIVSGTMPADDLIVTVEYEPIDYTLTINYVDSETGLAVSTAHTQTLHYGAGYSVNSPDVIGYGSPSEVIVSGTMPADNLIVTVEYEPIDYTLTINYLNRETGDSISASYVETLHYSQSYEVGSPAILGYDKPSEEKVSGTMPADDVTIDVYYDSHDFGFQYIEGDDDTPSDLRCYKIFHRDGSDYSYPVKIGFNFKKGDPVGPFGTLEFTNTNSNPLIVTTNNAIGVEESEKCLLYWYDTDNEQWVRARARVSALLYEVIFDANGGHYADSSTAKSDYAYAGGGVESPAYPEMTGHTFIGWDINGDGVLDSSDDLNGDGLYNAQDIDEIVVEASMAVKALYEINTYEVTTSVVNGTITPKLAVNYGEDAVITYHANSGCHLSCVTVDGVVLTDLSSCQTSYTIEDINANHTIDVEFAVNEYTVRFFEQDGTTQIGETQTVAWNTAADMETAPQIAGYAFDKWVLTGADEGETDSLTNVKENIDAVASYVKNGYTVIFLDYEGKVIGTDGVLYGGAATAPVVPLRVGYSFANWDKAFNNVTGNLTVTAQYKINTFTVKFVDFDGRELKSQTVNWSTAATAPANPTFTGYTFTGWDKSFDKVTSDLTVKAQYAINAYTVKFVDHDGKELNSQSVNWGTAAIAPMNPTRTGYTFTGWDKAFNNVTSDLTVTAQYKQNETVTLDDGDIPKTYDDSQAFPWWWIVVAAALVGAIVSIIVFQARKHKKTGDAV